MENNDSVCFIAKINSIVPILGADKIEAATVNGWSSIVQKGIHKVDDLVLCVATEAVIPEDLAIKWGVIAYLRKGRRVRTVKLKGVYSEAILIPVLDIEGATQAEYDEGEDMMKELKIFKYEEPENLHTGQGTGQPRSSKKRTNQNFNKYYKFPNIKNVPNMFNEKDEVVITRKIHGSNARYGILKKTKLSIIDRIRKFFGNKEIEYGYVYGSHNVQKQTGTPGYYKTDVWADIAQRYDMESKLWGIAKKHIPDGTIGKGFVLHGEVYGPGIQGATYSYGQLEPKFVAFDIEWDDEYFDRDNFELFCPTDTVEVLYKGKWSQEIQDRYTFNQFIGSSEVPHEGIVISSVTGDRKKMAKVINPDYYGYAEKHHVLEGH